MNLRSIATRTLIGLPFLTAACVSQPDDRDLGEAAPVEATSGLGVAPAWHYLGPVELTAAAHEDQWHPTPASAAAAEAAPVDDVDPVLHQFQDESQGTFSVMYVDFGRRAEYVATYDAGAVHDAAAELARRGFNRASKAEAELEVANGLSNNIDNRISFADYAVTHSTLRRIGRVGGGCSGALFGPRVVLTAAHCIFDSAGNYQANNTFAPRRNGAATPYGVVTSQGAVYPISFKNDNCHLNYTSACVKNDWAILVLPPNPWAGSANGSPGYLGVWWAGDAAVTGFDVRNVGYPACSSSMAPAGCQSNVAYGDLTCAGVNPTVSEADSRWPLNGTKGKLTTGCDTSGGHSGGPIYSYSPGDNGPYLVGNTVWNQCNSSSCNALTQYSSAGIRISENLAAYMMNLRATYQ